MFQKYLIGLLLAMATSAPAAFAIPLRSPNEVIPRQLLAAEQMLIPRAAPAYDFEGIVELSNCSGSLIKFENAADTDQALVMTNGHCIGGNDFLKPGEVVTNKQTRRMMTLLKTTDDGVDVYADMLLYATMTDTDVSIYRLRVTYKEIMDKHQIRPWILSSAHPEIGQDMEVISGYWHKGYSCKIEAFIFDLQEGDWNFKDSIRYSRPGCETIGGTSGSPVVLKGTRQVIGINNTGNENGQRCTENNPCEINEKGEVFFQKGYSYGQQTYQIYTCLNDKNEIDLSLQGCSLPK